MPGSVKEAEKKSNRILAEGRHHVSKWRKEAGGHARYEGKERRAPQMRPKKKDASSLSLSGLARVRRVNLSLRKWMKDV